MEHHSRRLWEHYEGYLEGGKMLEIKDGEKKQLPGWLNDQLSSVEYVYEEEVYGKIMSSIENLGALFCVLMPGIRVRPGNDERW